MIHDLDSYDYSYPDELVALNPLAAKDQANMLVFKNNSFYSIYKINWFKVISYNLLYIL